MKLIEDLLSKRETAVFIGVENHSTPYNPLLFSKIWSLPENLPSNNLLILPIDGLSEPYLLSKERMTLFDKKLWVLFVKSHNFTHNAFLFDSFPQTDDNTYFTKESIEFLTNEIHCRTVVICDMGVYKSRSLINLLNCAISSLEEYNISVCLAIILGYNTRGYTDIEVENECDKYQKDYYLHSDIEANIVSDNFNFLQIESWFKFSDLFLFCSLSKSQAEIKLQMLKQEALPYNALKTLWDYGFINKTIESLNKGDSFDFKNLENNLSKMGFKGELIDSDWKTKFDTLCRDIRISNKSNRAHYVEKLISAIGDNINTTTYFVNLI